MPENIRSRLSDITRDQIPRRTTSPVKKDLRFDENTTYKVRDRMGLHDNNENAGKSNIGSKLPSDFFGNSWNRRPSLSARGRTTTSDRSNHRDEVKSRLANTSLNSNFEQEKRLQNAASLLGNTLNMNRSGSDTATNMFRSPYGGRSRTINEDKSRNSRLMDDTRHEESRQREDTIPILSSRYKRDIASVIPSIIKRSSDVIREHNDNRKETSYGGHLKARNYDRSYIDSSYSQNKFKTKEPQESIPFKTRLLQLSSNMMNSLLGVGSNSNNDKVNNEDTYRFSPTNYNGNAILKRRFSNERIPELPKPSYKTYIPLQDNDTMRHVSIPLPQEPLQSTDEVKKEDRTSEFLDELNKLKQELKEVKGLQEQADKNKKWAIEKERLRLSNELEIKKMEIEKKESEREIIMLRKMLREKNFELERYKKRRYADTGIESDSDNEDNYDDDDDDDDRQDENYYRYLLHKKNKNKRQRKSKYYTDGELDKQECKHGYEVEMSPGLHNKVGIDKVGKDMKRMKSVVKESKREVEKIKKLLSDDDEYQRKKNNKRAYLENVTDN